MNTTEKILHEAMSREAETMTMAPHLRAGIDARARRYRVRRTATAAAGALAVVAISVAVPLAIRDGSDKGSPPAPATQPAPAPAYESWAPRGALADNDAFIRRAVRAWDAGKDGSSLGPHTDVRVLWADAFETGRGAVLVGTDATGARRLTVVAGGGELKPIRDVAAPASLTHLSFNLFTDDESHSPKSYRDTLVVLMPPGTGWTVEWAAESANEAAGGAYSLGMHKPGAPGPDGFLVTDISDAGPKGEVKLEIRDGDRILYHGPIGSMS